MPRPCRYQAFSWPQRRHENPCGQRCSKSAWRQSSSVGYISMKSISVFGCRTIFASLWVAAQEATGGTGRKGMVMSRLSGRVRGEGEGLSGRTVFHIHRILSTALNFAVDLRYVQTNVAGSARPPKPEEKEMHALDVSEVEKALEALKTWPDRRLRAIVLLATFTGLRRGELLALRWKDVDLEGGTVTVARAAQHVKGQGIVFRKPKTSKSRRTIALPQTAVDALTAHAAAQADEMLLV